MITTSDFIRIPYKRDLTEGGIAYAIHSLPYLYNRVGGTVFDRLRRIVASAAVELAFRRYLSEHEVPYDVKGATPFTEPDRYDVSLGGRRCTIQSFLITRRDQVREMKRNPALLLNAPALMPSDQNAAEGHLNSDIYLFAFLSGLVETSQNDPRDVTATDPPRYFIHAMPDSWTRPVEWHPLGALVLKSDSEHSQRLEIGGQDTGRAMRSLEIEVPPKTRVQIDNGFFSLAYIHSRNKPGARIGIHSSARKETYIIGQADWGNIWVDDMDILLTGYLTREEYNRSASFLREGSRVFQYDRTRTKNLAVSVSDLKPLSELWDRLKNEPRVKGES